LYVSSGGIPTRYRLVILSLPPRRIGRAHSCMYQVEVNLRYRLVILSLPPRRSGRAHSCMYQVEVNLHVTGWLIYRYRRTEVEGLLLYVSSEGKPTRYRLVNLSLRPRRSGRSLLYLVEVNLHVTGWLFYSYRRVEVDGCIVVSTQWVFLCVRVTVYSLY